MTTYNTEQKKELVDFLTKNSHRSFTIDEICQGMKDDEEMISPPGKSTLYRLIPKLLEENIIKQFNNGTNRRAYQIVGGQNCSSHIHLKCTRCGRILHTSNEVTAELVSRIAGSDAFQINTGQTILFGLCRECV